MSNVVACNSPVTSTPSVLVASFALSFQYNVTTLVFAVIYLLALDELLTENVFACKYNCDESNVLSI